MSEHDHVHHDVEEVIEASSRPQSRRRLLVAGLANLAFMISGGIVASKANAHPSLADAIHNSGDVAYYLTPWLVTLRHRIDSRRAALWMRGTAIAVSILAFANLAHDTAELFDDDHEKPAVASVPLQAALALGNGAVALYFERSQSKSRSNSIDRASLGHARRDALTSGLAAGFNTLALAAPIVNPLGAVVINGLTIDMERKNIRDINQALREDNFN